MCLSRASATFAACGASLATCESMDRMYRMTRRNALIDSSRRLARVKTPCNGGWMFWKEARRAGGLRVERSLRAVNLLTLVERNRRLELI